MRWDLDPILYDFGPIAIRWYGLCFVVGLLLAVKVLDRVFDGRGYPRKEADALALWLPLGMIVGAHLIHLVFYETDAFWKNPVRIVEIGKGLSSHGGALGAILVLWIFCRRKGRPFLEYADAAMVASVWVFPWVRIGNFCNSEIYGRPTDVPWAVVFVRESLAPRHPVQLYEALLGVALVVLAWRLERRRARMRSGSLFLAVLAVYFSVRFGLEYFKEYQALSPSFPFTMGQLLSAPVAILCGILLWRRRNVA